MFPFGIPRVRADARLPFACLRKRFSPMAAAEDSLSRRLDRLAYGAAAPDTTLLLGALKELALALEAIEEKVDRLAAAKAPRSRRPAD